MPGKIGLSESEYVIMSIIWDEDRELVFGDIYQHLKNDGYTWATQTVQTFLDNLIRKGALTFRRQGHKKIYYPAFSKSDFTAKWIKNVFENNFDSIDDFVLSFNKLSGQLSQAQKEELEKIWNE